MSRYKKYSHFRGRSLLQNKSSCEQESKICGILYMKRYVNNVSTVYMKGMWSKLNVEFDKRLELIFGLQYCVARKYNTNFDWIRENNKEYNDKFYEMYKNAITKEFEDYILNGGLESYNRCVELAFHLDKDYNFINIENIDNQILKYKKVNFEILENHLKEFVKKSNYEQFYESNKDYYDFIIEKFQAALNLYEQFSFDKIINFYGYKKGNMAIKLLNFSSGSYGHTLNGDLIYVNGVINNSKDKDKFRFSDGLVSNAYHEFSHPYINPLGQKYFGDTELSNIMLECQNNGLQSSYNNIVTALNEYCVRAVSIILIKNLVRKEYINRFIENMKKIGYPRLDELIEVFNKKDTYNTFEDFYKNEIVTYFIKLNNELGNSNAI